MKIIMIILIILIGCNSWLWAEKGTADEMRKLKFEIGQLKKESGKLDREISRVDSLKSEETVRFSQLEKNYTRDLERRKSEIAGLKSKLQDIRKKIRNEQRIQSRHKNSIEEVAAREKVLINLLVKHCEKLERAVEGSLPWEKETRLERIRVLKRDLEAGTAQLEEGFNRLTALYSGEIKFGDEIAVLNKPVTRNNGEVINARILKIGNQWIAYSDEEEKKYGLLERTQSEDGIQYRWRENFSFGERESIREALDVKTAKKPPKLVTLPLTLTLEGPDSTRGEP